VFKYKILPTIPDDEELIEAICRLYVHHTITEVVEIYRMVRS